MAYCWRVASDGDAPSDAFVGGKDQDSLLYIARAYHQGDLVPGKLNTKHQLCYVPWGGAEYVKFEYWVLCGSGFVWKPANGGAICPNSVVGGATIVGEKLYIGRVKHAGGFIVGKIHPSHKVCYVSYKGRELYFKNYEVLTWKNP